MPSPVPGTFTEVDKRLFIEQVRARDALGVSAALAAGLPADTVVDSHSGLYLAAGKNDVEMMDLLVRSGANPNLILGVRAKQRTALNKAAGDGSRDAVMWLLEHGANPRITDAKRRTAAHVLIGNLQKYGDAGGDKFCVRALERMLHLGLPIDQVDSSKRTLLHLATLVGSAGVPIVEFLLDRKANPYVTDGDGRMPIHIACRGNRAEVLRTLVAKGVSIDTADEQGRRALHLYDSTLMGEAIFDLDPDLECQDIDGHTALAARLKNLAPDRITAEVQQLLEKGASLETPNFEGVTGRQIIAKRSMVAVAAFVGAQRARAAMRRVTASAKAAPPAVPEESRST